MKDINKLINELIAYGTKTGLIDEADKVYTINRLLELFKLDEYEADDTSGSEEESKGRVLNEILDDMMDYALSEGIMENDTVTFRDLFDTKIMGLITPAPSIVRSKFDALYKESPEAATEYYYDFSKATNYIRTDRIARDEKWITATEFGDLDITINWSKPEKDPRDIAAA